MVRRLALSQPVEPAIRWKAPDCPVEVVDTAVRRMGMEPRPKERELAEPSPGNRELVVALADPACCGEP